jgi:hypothetical protein
MGAGEIVMLRLAILLLAVFLHAHHAAAATHSFDEANRLYEQGKFAEAAAAYEKIASAGAATANVWFNLGNANYKSGQLGRSIAAYRMAERLQPRDDALRANLQFVRGKVYADERTHVPRWKTTVRLATLHEWTVLTVGLLWAFFSVLACGEFAGRRYTKAIVTLLVLFLIAGTGTVMAWSDLREAEAVVAAREATVRFGPLEESQSAFQLRDGAELSVLSAKNEWLEIRDPERRSGWIRRDEVVLLH